MNPIFNFETYAISIDGRVINNITKKVKKPTDNHSGNGYLYVDLYKDGKRHRKYVHRLVAEAYIPNPFNLPIVNHIDGNPKNNNYKNLEWCTPKQNVEHAAKILKVVNQYQRANNKRKKQIYGFNIITREKTRVFNSIREASKIMNIPSSNIVANLKGRQSHTRNIIWCYVEELR